MELLEELQHYKYKLEELNKQKETIQDENSEAYKAGYKNNQESNRVAGRGDKRSHD